MSAIKIIDFEAGQKLIDPTSTLLWSGFDLDGLKLDLYGTFDSDGYLVEDVAIANMRISVWELLTPVTIDYLVSECNEYLTSWAEHKQDVRSDVRGMQRSD